MQEEGPWNITALIFHPGLSRARRFAPVFNITPRSRMFYPPPPPPPRPSRFPSPLFYFALHPRPPPPPALDALRTESRGIAPRNEFTILIWRAALAIYYTRCVGEKKNPGMRRWKEDKRQRVVGNWWWGEDRAALEGGATIREGRKYIVSICEHRDKTIIL